MKKTLSKIIPYSPIVAFFAPVISFAQGYNYGGSSQLTGGTTVGDIIDTIADIVNRAIPVLISLIVLFLIFNGIKYARASEENDKTDARKAMIASATALFVVLTIWGLIAIVAGTFGVEVGGTQDQLPSVQTL